MVRKKENGESKISKRDMWDYWHAEDIAFDTTDKCVVKIVVDALDGAGWVYVIRCESTDEEVGDVYKIRPEKLRKLTGLELAMYEL